MPSEYQIVRTNRPSLTLSVSDGGAVVTANEEIDWAISLPFRYVGDYCRRKGWTVIPVIEDECPHVLDFKGIRYTLHWKLGRLSSIMRDDGVTEKEITWHELPEQLKGIV